MNTARWIGRGLLIVATCTPWISHAGQKQGRITSIHLAQGHVDKVFIKIDGSYSPPEPSCSAGVSQWDFVLGIQQSTGKAIYAQLMAAQYSQTPLLVVGTDNCSLIGNYETLSYIVVDT
jgi:hypothetical protein